MKDGDEPEPEMIALAKHPPHAQQGRAGQKSSRASGAAVRGGEETIRIPAQELQ
jgi:hypothetical protein